MILIKSQGPATGGTTLLIDGFGLMSVEAEYTCRYLIGREFQFKTFWQ